MGYVIMPADAQTGGKEEGASTFFIFPSRSSSSSNYQVLAHRSLYSYYMMAMSARLGMGSKGVAAADTALTISLAQTQQLMKKTSATSNNKSTTFFYPLSPFIIRHCCRYMSSYPSMDESHGKANPRKRVTATTLRNLYKNREKITMLTAHDFPSGHVADAAGIDVILVGDSLAMVSMGQEDTSEITMEDMLLHCRSVARAAKSSFTVRSSHPPSSCMQAC